MFSYVIRLGADPAAPSFDIDHDEDLTVGRFATLTLTDRLVIPFADETELVLAPGSELTGIVVEKETTHEGERDPAEAAFRVVREATRSRSRSEKLWRDLLPGHCRWCRVGGSIALAGRLPASEADDPAQGHQAESLAEIVDFLDGTV